MKQSGASRVLGLDIGATHSRARLVEGREVIAEARDVSASIAAEGAEAAVATLDNLLSQLPLDEGFTVDAVCAGAAGLVSKTTVELFEKRLSRFTKGGLVLIVADGYLVLPAANLVEGVGVVCGTGTVAMGQIGGRRVPAGGWGYLVGDDGSGYWVVREAIRSLLDRQDRGRPLGVLGAELLRAVNAASIEELRDLVYADPRPGKWAAFAPVVLSSSDPLSSIIIASAARSLDRLI